MKSHSSFLRLLANHSQDSRIFLNRKVRRQAHKLIKKRQPIVDNAPWTIGIIIDDTLHKRSNIKVNNSQKFTKGDNWVSGHQWTNICLLVCDQIIPLPPIPFYTFSECQEMGVEYKSSHQKIVHFIKTLNISDIFGDKIRNDEIVFLLDGGFDDKNIQNVINSRGFHFIAALKKDRCFIKNKNKYQISKIMNDGRFHMNKKTIRLKASGHKNKRKEFRVKELTGRLKGVICDLKLVSSKKVATKSIKYFATNNLIVDLRIII